MRASTELNDRSDLTQEECFCPSTKVWLDDVEQKFAIVADEEAGYVVRYTDLNFANQSTEVVHGRVRIEVQRAE